MSRQGIPPELLNPLATQWLDEITSRAMKDSFLTSALLLIEELYTVIQQQRPIDRNYMPMLYQMLAVQACVRVQAIGWRASSSSGGAAP